MGVGAVMLRRVATLALVRAGFAPATFAICGNALPELPYSRRTAAALR